MTTDSRRLTIIFLAVALLVSVCLNLFAVGAWFGGLWADARSGHMLEAVMRPYPPSLRREIRQKLFADRSVLQRAATEFRAARGEMFAVMRADPLDRAALDKAMKKVREKAAKVQALLQETLAESLVETPATERRKIGEPQFSLGLGQGEPD